MSNTEDSMLPMRQVGDDCNEGEIVLGTDADFEDVGPSKPSHLGRARLSESLQDATSGQEVAHISIQRTSAAINVREIFWGTYQNQPACRIYLDSGVRSSEQFELATTYFACQFGPSLQEPSGVAPRVEWFLPKGNANLQLDIEGAIVTDTGNANPQVSVGGVAVGLGSLTRQRVYRPFEGYIVDGSFFGGQILWTISNKASRTQRVYILETEILVLHGGNDFSAKFELEAELKFSSRMKTLGRNSNKPVAASRNFRALPSMGVIEVGQRGSN